MLQIPLRAGLASVALVAGVFAMLIGFSDNATSTTEVLKKGDRLISTARVFDVCNDTERAEYGMDCVEAVVDAENALDIRYVTIGGQVAPATTIIAKVPRVEPAN